jgi:hypothetical protein
MFIFRWTHIACVVAGFIAGAVLAGTLCGTAIGVVVFSCGMESDYVASFGMIPPAAPEERLAHLPRVTRRLVKLFGEYEETRVAYEGASKNGEGAIELEEEMNEAETRFTTALTAAKYYHVAAGFLRGELEEEPVIYQAGLSPIVTPAGIGRLCFLIFSLPHHSW